MIVRITAPKVLAAAAVAGAALPAMGAAAAIGLQDDRMAASQAAEIPGRIALAEATGTQVLRIDLFWATAAPTKPANPTDHLDPAYDWTWADTTLCGVVKAGMQPIVSTWNAPGWATGGAKGTRGVVWNSKAPRKAQDYADFMSALATRYNGRTEIPGQGTCKVKFYEIWNEPNLSLYFAPQYSGRKVVSSPKYVQMVNRAVPAIRRANRSAVPIVGVTGPKGKSDKTGRGTLDWIKDMRRYGIKPGPWQYSQHIYPAVGPTSKRRVVPSWGTLPEIASAVNQLPGGRSKKIYITEASYTTAKTTYRKVAFTTAQQRTFMKQIFRLPFVKSSRVPVVIWFQLQDNPDWPGGIRTFAGGQKPAYATFQQLTKTNRPKGNLRPGS
ncbi:MAG: hypothetical protein O3B97_03035 [Actinomycetota bacterium]|nr:hypothetical protein [Actinomycetota bacterium]